MKKQTSLSRRINFTIGSLLAGLLSILFLVILFLWRSEIIENKKHEVEKLTNVFSTTIVDIWIDSEFSKSDINTLYQEYISNLKIQVPEIVYVNLYDKNMNAIILDERKYLGNHFDNAYFYHGTNIFLSEDNNWLVETALPLKIHDKLLGFIVIAYDANNINEKLKDSFFVLIFSTIIIIFISLQIIKIFSSKITVSLNSLTQRIKEMSWKSDKPLGDQDSEVEMLSRHFDLINKQLIESKKRLIDAEKQIFHAEKLASIGRLASGIAHEINNPINGIKNCIYSIKEEPTNIEQIKEYSNLIDEALVHIESVIQKLLGFSRKSSKSLDDIDIRVSLEKVLQLIKFKQEKKSISILVNSDDSIPKIKADPTLIEEVFMNLLINAIDAVDDKGKIIINISYMKYIIIEIIDNGHGINNNDLAEIFEPFFTTKPVGKGTGLGLSVVEGIIHAYNGSISVVSSAKETKFTVFLPGNL